jgi:CRISPR/Cas system-associated exonuclease Cas4 (RecB family)
VVIDRLFTGPFGLVLLDIKSGSQMPKDDLQLAVYRLALQESHGFKVMWGMYFDARKAQTSASYNLTKWPKERVDYIFRSVRTMQEQGIFLANPSNLCSACGVREYCATMGGSLAHTVPPAWTATDSV